MIPYLRNKVVALMEQHPGGCTVAQVAEVLQVRQPSAYTSLFRDKTFYVRAWVRGTDTRPRMLWGIRAPGDTHCPNPPPKRPKKRKA